LVNILRITVILLGIVIAGSLLFNFLSNRTTNNHEKSISANNITSIKVAADTGVVKIAPHDGEDILVQITGKKLSKDQRLTLTKKNNTVAIEAKSKSKFRFAIKSPVFTVLVKLPGKEYERLQIHTDVANIHVDSIHATEYYVKTDVGNIKINGIHGAIHAESDVGNIHLHLQHIANDIVAKTEVGNISVRTKEAPVALQTEFNTSAGKTTVTLPNFLNGSIGVNGPLVKLASEVGNISLLLDED
jgi:DUF4097 and DUF4098 domain-containing protein YvlB